MNLVEGFSLEPGIALETDLEAHFLDCQVLKDNPGIMIKLQKSNVNVQSLFSKYEIHVLNVFTCFY